MSPERPPKDARVMALAFALVDDVVVLAATAWPMKRDPPTRTPYIEYFRKKGGEENRKDDN